MSQPIYEQMPPTFDLDGLDLAYDTPIVEIRPGSRPTGSKVGVEQERMNDPRLRRFQDSHEPANHAKVPPAPTSAGSYFDSGVLEHRPHPTRGSQ